MNTRRLLQVLVLLGVALAVVFVVDRVDNVDPLLHDRTTVALMRLQELDARLNQDVLESRYRIHLDYGPLVHDLGEIETMHASLREPPRYLSRESRAEFAERLRRHESAMAEKAALVEQFKSGNAIQDNSLHYAPLIFEDLAQDWRIHPADAIALGRLDGLLRDVLIYQISPDTLLAPAIRGESAWLASRAHTTSADDRDKLQIALAHVARLIETKPEVDRIIRGLMAIPSEEYGTAFIATYSAGYTAAIARANVTRALLYGIAALLLVLVAYTMAKLRAAAEQLREANEGLERRVQERTHELRASVGRYRSLVEKSRVVPWEYDPAERRLLYIAPQIADVLGLAVEDVMGEGRLHRAVHADDRDSVERFLDAAVDRPRDAGSIDFRINAPGRGIVHVRSIAALDYSDGRTVVRGVSMDITSEMRLESELRQAQKLESVGRLAAGVAHEINTPVQFVSDSVHFVRNSTTELFALIAEYESLRLAVAEGRPAAELAAALVAKAEAADLEYVTENVPVSLDRALNGLERIATIVRAMKSFAHPEQKEKAPCDINDAVLSTLTISRNEYKYVAEIETEFADLPPVLCRAGELNQAILNIVVNAAHAISDVVGTSGQLGKIRVATRREDGDVAIEIGDTGGGIPDAIRDRIFDPFFTTKEVGKGTGQGLAIARSIVVDKHGGTLTCDSVPGAGTTFTIRIPIAPQASPAGESLARAA